MRVVGFRDIQAGCLVEADDQVEEIHRIQFELVRERLVGLDFLALDLGGDVLERAFDEIGDFGFGHSCSGSLKISARRLRKRAATRPSLTR